MKRGIAAGVIIVLVTAVAIWSNFTLVNKAESLQNAAVNAAQNKNKLTALEDEWEKHSGFFAFFVDHSHFEHIEFDILRLKFLDGEKYEAVCTEVGVHLRQMSEHISFSFDNLF